MGGIFHFGPMTFPEILCTTLMPDRTSEAAGFEKLTAILLNVV